MTIVGAVEFEARLDTRGLVKSINELTRTEFSPLTIRVDDRELTRLNKHIEAKRQHVRSVQDYLNNNPITPRSDTGEIEEAIKKIQALKKSVGDLKSNIRISSEIKVTHELKSQKNNNTADLSSLNVAIGRASSRISITIDRSSSAIQAVITSSTSSLRSSVSSNSATISSKINKTNSILSDIAANIPDAIGKAVKRHSGDGLLTSLIKLPFKMLGSAGSAALSGVSRGFYEDIGGNISKGFGAGAGAKNASKNVKRYMGMVDEYLIGGVDKFMAAFLAELTRSGNFNKAIDEAVPRLRVMNEYADKFQNMMDASGLLDKIKRGEEVSDETIKLLAKYSPRKRSEARIRKSIETLQKDPTNSNAAVLLSNDIFGGLLPNMNPQDLIQGFINPMLKEFSPIINFIGRIQQERSITGAKSKLASVLALLPKLQEGEEGYLQVIGGAMARKGKGSAKMESLFEPLVPSRRVLPVDNPDTDPEGQEDQDPMLEAVLNFMGGLAPEAFANQELYNTFRNIATLISQSINPMFQSRAVTDALANIMAAIEAGVSPDKIATVSYSLGGKEARALAEALEILGIEAKTLALAYPELNASQRKVANFMASLIEPDALGFVKNVLQLGGDDNMAKYAPAGTPPSAEAHAPKHYFEDPKQVQDFFEFLGISPPDTTNVLAISNYFNTAEALVENLTRALQVSSLMDTGKLDPNKSLEGQEIKSADLIIDFLESVYKSQNFRNFSSGEKVSPEMAAVTDKLTALEAEAYAKLEKALVEQFNFKMPEGEDQRERAAQLFGQLKIQRFVQSDYLKTLDDIETENAKSDNWFTGGLDPARMVRQTEDLLKAAAYFKKQGALPNRESNPEVAKYHDTIIAMFENLRNVIVQYAKDRKLTPEVKAALAKARSLPMLDEMSQPLPEEIAELFGQVLKESETVPRQQQREFTIPVPKWLYKSPGAAIAYNQMLEDVGSEGYVPPLDELLTVAYGMSGASSFIGEDFVYKNEPGNPQAVASEREIAAYEQLAGRYSPLMYAANPGKALVVERVKGTPVKDILDELAVDAKASRAKLAELREQLENEDDEDKREALLKSIEEESKAFAQHRKTFNEEAIKIYEQIGRLGNTLIEMGVAHGDLASANVFRLDDGTYTSIDLGNAVVNPDLMARIQDQATTIQRAAVDREFWGILDPIKVAEAIMKGYSGEVLPEQAKRVGSVDDLPKYQNVTPIPLGSEQEGLLQEHLQYKEAAKQAKNNVSEGKKALVAGMQNATKGGFLQEYIDALKTVDEELRKNIAKEVEEATPQVDPEDAEAIEARAEAVKKEKSARLDKIKKDGEAMKTLVAEATKKAKDSIEAVKKAAQDKAENEAKTQAQAKADAQKARVESSPIGQLLLKLIDSVAPIESLLMSLKTGIYDIPEGIAHVLPSGIGDVMSDIVNNAIGKITNVKNKVKAAQPLQVNDNLASELTEKFNKGGLKKIQSRLGLSDEAKIPDIKSQIESILESGEYTPKTLEKIKKNLADNKIGTVIDQLQKEHIAKLIAQNFGDEAIEEIKTALDAGDFMASAKTEAAPVTGDSEAVSKFVKEKSGEIRELIAKGGLESAKDEIQNIVAGIETFRKTTNISGDSSKSLNRTLQNVRQLLDENVSESLEEIKGKILADLSKLEKATPSPDLGAVGNIPEPVEIPAEDEPRQGGIIFSRSAKYSKISKQKKIDKYKSQIEALNLEIAARKETLNKLLAEAAKQTQQSASDEIEAYTENLKQIDAQLANVQQAIEQASQSIKPEQSEQNDNTNALPAINNLDFVRQIQKMVDKTGASSFDELYELITTRPELRKLKPDGSGLDLDAIKEAKAKLDESIGELPELKAEFQSILDGFDAYISGENEELEKAYEAYRRAFLDQDFIPKVSGSFLFFENEDFRRDPRRQNKNQDIYKSHVTLAQEALQNLGVDDLKELAKLLKAAGFKGHFKIRNDVDKLKASLDSFTIHAFDQEEIEKAEAVFAEYFSNQIDYFSRGVDKGTTMSHNQRLAMAALNGQAIEQEFTDAQIAYIEELYKKLNESVKVNQNKSAQQKAVKQQNETAKKQIELYQEELDKIQKLKTELANKINELKSQETPTELPTGEFLANAAGVKQAQDALDELTQKLKETTQALEAEKKAEQDRAKAGKKPRAVHTEDLGPISKGAAQIFDLFSFGATVAGRAKKMAEREAKRVQDEITATAEQVIKEERRGVAKRRAKAYKDPELQKRIEERVAEIVATLDPDAKIDEVTLVATGFRGPRNEQNSAEALSKKYQEATGRQGAVVPIDSTFTPDVSSDKDPAKWAKQAFQKMYAHFFGEDTVLESAEEMAAQAIAYAQVYGDAQVKAIGHSAGGVVSRQAKEIAQRMGGPKIRAAYVGTPVGISSGGDEQGFMAYGDPFSKLTKLIGMLTNFVKGESHDFGEYMQGVSGALINNFLNKTEAEIKAEQDALMQKFMKIVAEMSGYSQKEAENVSTDVFRIPEIVLDEERLAEADAKAQYDSDKNIIYVTQDILNALQSGANNLGEYNDEVMSIIHELRHAFQTDFGLIDAADIGAGVEQAGVELQASAQSIAKGARAVEEARKAGGYTEDELAAIAQLEADAYEFENRATEAIRNIQLDELSGIARILKGIEFKFSDVTESARGFFTALSEGIATANEMDASMTNFLQGIANASPEMAALVENAQGFLETFSAIGLATLAFEKLMEALPEALDIAAEFEFVKLQMQNIEGSAYGAKQLFDEIKNLANDTGNDLRTTLDGFAQLTAATRGTTLEGGATKQIMESMLTAGAVYGMDAEQMDRAMLAITQTASRGAVSMEELRGQLSESLPGAFQIAARAMNVTDRELTRLIETGSLMSSDFLPKFAKQIELELGGSVQSAVGGLVKKRILYQNKLTEMLHGLGETFAPLEALRLDVLTKSLELISKHIKTITTAIISAGIYALITKLAAAPAIAAAMGVGLAAVINLLRVSLIPIIKSVSVGFIQTFFVVKAIEVGIKLLLAVTKGWLGEFNQTNTQKWADELVDAMKRARKEAKDLKKEIEGVNDSTNPNNNKPGDGEDAPEPKSRTAKVTQESRRIMQQISAAEAAKGKNHWQVSQAVSDYQQKNAVSEAWKWLTALRADWNERKEIRLFKDELKPGRDFPKELENIKALLADETRIAKIKDLNEQIEKATSNLITAKNETEKSAILRQIERLNNLRNAEGGEYDTALKEISAKIKNFQKMLDDGIVQNPENKAFLKGKIDEWTKLRDALEAIKKEVDGLQSLSILVDDMNRLSITIDRIASSAEKMSQLDNIEILSKQLATNSVFADENIDRFASLNAQLSQSEKQWQRSARQVLAYQSAILELQKHLGNSAISSELQAVDPLLNKKYMDMNSRELEFAQEGIDDSQQAKIKAIEYLLQLRQAENDLLAAQVEEMESIVDFQEQQMERALQMIAIRREDQDIKNQIANAAASVKITRAEFGEAGYDIELERAKQAEAEAVQSQALVFEEMSAITAAYTDGKITVEKYYEEIGRLKSEAAQEGMSLAEAELQVKRAAEQKFLEEFRESVDEQRRLRERNHAVAIKQIRELQLARAINPEQAAYQEALANQRNQDNIADLENRRREIHNAMVTGRLSKDEGETQINEIRDQITQAIQQQSESALQVQQAGRAAAIEAVEQAILESQVAGQMSQVQATLSQAEAQVGNSANSPIEQIRAELELIEARRNAAIENAQKKLQTAIQAGQFSSAGIAYQEALAQVQNPGNDPLEKLRNLVALEQARRTAMLDDAIRDIQMRALNESWNPEEITLAEAQAKVNIGADDFAQQILNEIELVKAEIAYQLSLVQNEIKAAESRIASENISAQTSVYQTQLNAIKRFGRNTEQVQKATQKRLLDVELARLDKSLKQAEKNLEKYQDMQFASEQERIDTIREAENQIAQLTLERIQKEIEAEESKAEEIVRIFDKQIARQQRAQERFNNWSEQFTTRQGMLTETLNRQNELFNAQVDLVQKLANFDEVRASNARNASKASEDYIKQLISLQKAMSEEGGNTEGNRYKEQVLAELAGVSASGNLSIDLQEQFNETAKREQQLLERKERALLNQERIQKAQLEIQIAMTALSAKSAVIEAQIANIKAKQAEAEARMQLAKAQKTGSADEIAAAKQALRFAQDAVGLTQEQIDMAQVGAGLQGAVSEIQRNALFADQQTSREQFNAEGQAIADENKLKGADLAAEGLVSPRGLRDVDFDPLKVQEAAMKSLSEQTAKAISSSMTGFVADLTQANTTIGNGIGAISEKLDKIYTRLDNIRASGETNLTVVSNDPAGDVSKIYEDIARSGLVKW